MGINFFTKNIDKNFYSKAILDIFDYFKISATNVDKWKINIYPIEHYKNNPDYYSGLVDAPTSSKMAWGHTGNYEINCFIIDSIDYRTALLSNFVVISHEIGHAILYTIFGGISKIYVNEVHDIYYKNPKYHSLQVDNIIIRILDITSSLEKDRFAEIEFLPTLKYRFMINAYSIQFYKLRYKNVKVRLI